MTLIAEGQEPSLTILGAEPTQLLGNIYLGSKEMANNGNLMAAQNIQVVADFDSSARSARVQKGTGRFASLTHCFLRLTGMP